MKENKLFLCFLISFFLFQTACKKEMMLIETGSASEVLSTTANISGYLNSAGEGIKKYGHCYAKTTGPTILDTRTEFSSTIGIGEFTSFLYDLEPGITYYSRAYISSGNILLYGCEISFTTASP